MIEGLFSRKRTKGELFKELYEENFDYIYRFVYSRLVGNKSMAEDVVQDIFITALKVFDDFKGESSYRTWLCGIAKHKIIDAYRKELADSVEYCDEITGSIANIEDDALLIENKVMVKDALNHLMPVYRYALILKYLDGMSIKEIAEAIGRTPKAVDGILQRAKKEFKSIYSDLLEDGNERG